MQTFLLIPLKEFLRDTRLQNVQCFQRLNQFQVAPEDRKLDLHKNGDRKFVFYRCQIAFPVQPRSLDLLVEISRKQIEASMLESEPFRTFSDSALAKNQASLPSLDRGTDKGPLFESRDAATKLFLDLFYRF